MKSIQILTFFLFFCSSMVFSQKTIKHTVVEGESIYSIAKKYKVSESDIYELNPKSKGALLQLKTVLLIPNKNSKSKDKTLIKIEDGDHYAPLVDENWTTLILKLK